MFAETKKESFEGELHNVRFTLMAFPSKRQKMHQINA